MTIQQLNKSCEDLDRICAVNSDSFELGSGAKTHLSGPKSRANFLNKKLNRSM